MIDIYFSGTLIIGLNGFSCACIKIEAIPRNVESYRVKGYEDTWPSKRTLVHLTTLCLDSRVIIYSNIPIP